jgi:signal transduction histidine kinase
VFQRHVRAHPGVADGTGLGLPIARQVLHQHGGTIHLESREGVGTTVRFDLPVVEGGPEQAREMRTTELSIAVRGTDSDGED